MTASAPLLLAALKRDAVGLVDVIPAILGTDKSIIHTVKGTIRTVAGVADAISGHVVGIIEVTSDTRIMALLAIQRVRPLGCTLEVGLVTCAVTMAARSRVSTRMRKLVVVWMT
jgi:hypothetical protein